MPSKESQQPWSVWTTAGAYPASPPDEIRGKVTPSKPAHLRAHCFTLRDSCQIGLIQIQLPNRVYRASATIRLISILENSCCDQIMKCPCAV